MQPKDRVPLVSEIAQANDRLAMEVMADLILLDCIPADSEITGEALIEKVVDYAKAISKLAPTFDFGRWREGTILEVLDFMICCGALDGPEVLDIEEEGHKLLSGKIKRNPVTPDYVRALEGELFDYVELVTPES